MTPSGDPSQGPSITEGQKLLQDEVRRFCEERIRPGVLERDRQHEFPGEILGELGEMGLLGMTVAEEYGGTGLSGLDLVIVVEEIARISPAVAISLSVSNSVCCWPINRFGTDDLKERVLPDLASGSVLGGFALTEPGSGSDAASMQSTAVRDGADWILNGEKAWITNAGAAQYFVVFARTDTAAGHRGISAFVVPAESPGLSIGAQEEKLGLRASLTASVHLHDCRVPAENLLGEMGQGFGIALATLDHSRLGIAAQAVGIHRRALELAVEYAHQRVQFNRPIA